MASNEELKARMDRATDIQDPLDRRLWVLAVITAFLEPSGVKPVLVGGAAVEFYTAGGYYTVDLDVIAESPALGEAMAGLGFEKSGRHWFREDIDIAIEAPSGGQVESPERVLALEIDGMTAYVIGIEDLIVDRLNAYVHWISAEDGRWTLRLIEENRAQIDWDYLRLRASQEKTADALDRLLERGLGDAP